MARTLNKRIVLVGAVTISGDATSASIADAAAATSGSVVVPVDDDEPLPRTLEEAEAIAEIPGRLTGAELTRARTRITELKTERDSR